MTNIKRVAFIGNSLPRQCGISTFTTHLLQAVQSAYPDIDTSIIAMTDSGEQYKYPDSVKLSVRENIISDYILAADYLNTAHYDVICLQHEFGIFGGVAGGHIVELVKRLRVPLITTLHTILTQPSVEQREVFEQIIALSARVIVMSEKGKFLLETIYSVPAEKIDLIPHGIPDFTFAEPDELKTKMGYENRPVILTFGLLSPNKGIEFMIDAMPAILQQSPNAMYVVLGATHPKMVLQHGEAYRVSLLERAHALNVHESIVFFDQFVDQAVLLDFIAMCDVYVTPYLNEAQMTSGTLAYSFGLGKAVVSTPYWHASELLANDRGVLVPFADAPALASAVAGLLTNDIYRLSIRTRAYASSRSMTWEHTAKRYITAFEKTQQPRRLRVIGGQDIQNLNRISLSPPALQFDHLYAMCDDTGILQHAIHTIADRRHGYCVDDNARALLLSCALNMESDRRLPEVMTSRFAAFIQHAWNPDNGRFRNFMSYNKHWLEDVGSEDSHCRTLWALGVCAKNNLNSSRRRWACDLFGQAITSVRNFSSPRAWAFALLGLQDYCAARPEDLIAAQIRHSLAAKLMASLAAVETAEWVWFENGLSYDNARLCQALIQTGMDTGVTEQVNAGLRSLRWLMDLQTTSTGLFRPVGTSGFCDSPYQPPKPFDQQPVDATATISACLVALHVTGKEVWRTDAARAFAWFFGRNDLALSLADVDTGRCRDGLHPDRANENCGAESVLSYLFSVAEIRQLARTNEQSIRPIGAADTIRPSARSSNQTRRGFSVTHSVFEPTGALSASRPEPGGGTAL